METCCIRQKKVTQLILEILISEYYHIWKRNHRFGDLEMLKLSWIIHNILMFIVVFSKVMQKEPESLEKKAKIEIWATYIENGRKGHKLRITGSCKRIKRGIFLWGRPHLAVLTGYSWFCTLYRNHYLQTWETIWDSSNQILPHARQMP